MKLAVLGSDAEVIQLLIAAKSAGHEIAWFGDVRPEDAAAIGAFAPVGPHRGDGEVRREQTPAGAVRVGQGPASADLREEQLKRLVAAAVPLLVVHPTGHSVLTYYELDMTRRETSDILRHYNPLLGHSLTAKLAEWVEHGHDAVGAIQQIAFQREMFSKARVDVLSWLARDAELLAAVAGNIRHVSAGGPRDTAASHSSLQVQLTTPRLSSLR